MNVPVRAEPPFDRAALLEQLSKHRMLRFIASAELEHLIAFAQPRSLAARKRLFAVGDAGSALYVILSGWVKLSREGPAGRDMLLEVAGPGTVFGELALICAAPRATDAVTLTVTRLLSIDGRALLAALRRNPDALLEIVRILAERLARMTEQIEDTHLSAEARLARALIRLAALDLKPSDACLRIDLGLSQSELGDLAGLSREKVNKQLSAWRDLGLIDLKGRSLILTDGVALGDIANPLGA